MYVHDRTILNFQISSRGRDKRQLIEQIWHPNSMKQSLQGQTVRWINAHFGVYRSLRSREKSLNIFQN